LRFGLLAVDERAADVMLLGEMDDGDTGKGVKGELLALVRGEQACRQGEQRGAGRGGGAG
jgi:hypothetical protein